MSDKEKYKLALFQCVKTNFIMPVGIKKGKSMDEINSMTKATIEILMKNYDFEKIKAAYYENGGEKE